MPSKPTIFACCMTLLLSLHNLPAAEPPEEGSYPRALAGDQELLSYAHLNGVKLAYRLEGAGVPVIFVHGEGYSHKLWNEQLEPSASAISRSPTTAEATAARKTR